MDKGGYSNYLLLLSFYQHGNLSSIYHNSLISYNILFLILQKNDVEPAGSFFSLLLRAVISPASGSHLSSSYSFADGTQ